MIPQKIGDMIIARSSMGEISLPELWKYATHEKQYVRSSVAVALGKLGDSRAYSLWEILLQDKEELVVGDAVLVAGAVDEARCLPKLAEMYPTATYQIKTRIINSLDIAESDEAKGLMQKLSESEDHPKLKTIIDGLLS